MDTETIWHHIDAERASLADLLSGLTIEQWDTPSVCPGWRVRDVAAHVISSPQARVWPVVRGLARARGDFNRMVYEEARRAGSQYAPAEIVAQYREYAGSRRHPPGTTTADPLLDVLIHTQDIARPLGIRRDVPVNAAMVAAERIWTKAFPFKARKRLAGVRLVATDCAWSVGEGAEVRGVMGDLLLVLSGRTVSVPELTGRGVDRLS
ncbi:uncharacterized protein (TIGR03083 family) [Kribbella amoyensis]|uniref:Uncharacterized protein (TIGR03083 family) n=1 Tax=Kribbella amoyensis TaxID=996641 RepID=A0A561B7Z9_9ACTN|nr:maleylpyruvate isomerase family mycothiol-dependent enzyme [Kribbella amoyensis]TWD74888.1 uncharacterized protein (TIGR03083 family) [Kribbella amoyensis]